MARTLVTGASGFIGSNLALELENLGHEVIATDRNLNQLSNLKDFKGKFIEWDVTRPFPLKEKFDYLFHQAAITDPRHPNDTEVYLENLSGFKNLLNLTEENGAKLIYASTAGLYGNGPLPMKESQPKEILTEYGRSKLDIDKLATEAMNRIPIIGLRYFNVFGPRESFKGRPSSMIYHLSLQMKAGKRPRIFSHGEQKRDHIYVKDVSIANIVAMTGPNGIYNVGTGVGTDFNELVSLLNTALGTQLGPEYFEMPYDPKTYQHHTVADTSLAETRLGFKAKWQLSDAIRDYHNYLFK